MPYNVLPQPTAYNPTFGGIPGPIGVPNPSADLLAQLPGLGDLNAAASTDVLSQLRGSLSPGTQKLLQDASAQFGVRSGMPLSGLARNKNLRDLGLTSEQMINQGIKNYASLIPTVSSTQTVNPALQAEIASRNALTAAAPVPGQAQSYAQSLFDKYLQMMRGPAGGTSTATSPASVGPSGFGQGGTPNPQEDPFDMWDYSGATPTTSSAVTSSYNPDEALLGWDLPLSAPSSDFEDPFGEF